MLLFDKQKVIQAMEGEPEVLNRVYDRVRRDERHKNVITVCRHVVSKRDFPHWAMGCSCFSIGDLLSSKEFSIGNLMSSSDFLEQEESFHELIISPGIAKTLLLEFRDSMKGDMLVE